MIQLDYTHLVDQSKNYVVDKRSSLSCFSFGDDEKSLVRFPCAQLMTRGRDKVLKVRQNLRAGIGQAGIQNVLRTT